MNKLKVIFASMLLFGFIALGLTYIKNHNHKLEIQRLELNSKESELLQLNNKYEDVLNKKTQTEQEKIDQQKKIEELEKERERLQKELQAKRNKSATKACKCQTHNYCYWQCRSP